MIDKEKVKNIYLYSREIDMRFGMKKIQSMISLGFSPEKILHSAFIFVSRSHRQIKIYYEDEFGTWLMINKLSYGKFQWIKEGEYPRITHEDLDWLLKGVEIKTKREKEIAI